MMNLLISIVMAMAMAMLGIPAFAQGTNGRVGPNVSVDQRDRDSTLNPYRATSQTSGGGGASDCSAEAISWTQGANTCSAPYSGGPHGSSSTIQDTSGTTVGVATVVCTNGVASGSGTCSTVTNCTSQSLSWTVGSRTCSATAAATNHGSNATVNDTSGASQGTATYSCSNGTFNIQSGSTCSNTPTQCAAQTVSWTESSRTCSGAAPLTAVGSSASVTATSGSGDADFTCNSSGSFVVQPGANCSYTCPSGSVSWTQGSATCSGTYSSFSNGSNRTVNDTTGPATGSASLTCNTGQVTIASSSCTDATSSTCAAQTVNWAVGGNSCSATYSGGAGGSSEAVVDSTGSVTGSATATCSSGVVGISNASCNVGAACVAQTMSWTVGGNTCSASYPSGASGTTATLADSTAPTTGSATATCSNGTVNLSGTSCASSASTCPSQTLNWTVGGNSCSASYAGGSSGSSATVTDSSAPTTGSATATCTNGSVATSSTTCTSTGSSCSAGQTLNWVVSSRQCSGTSVAASSGNTIVVSASGTNTGSADFQCNNGTFVVSGSPTCNAGGSPDGGASCPAYAAGTGWGTSGSGGSCTLNDPLPVTQSGKQVQVVDNVGVYQGQATGSCNDGTWSLLSTTCYQATSATPACDNISVNWTVGGVTCLSALPRTDQGTKWAGYDADTTTASGTAGSTGAKIYTCASSGWVADSQPAPTCALATAPPCAAMNPSWSVGGNTCSGVLQQTESGGSVTVPNETANLQGSALYACSNGSWSLQSGSSCAPSTIGCPSVFNEWTDTGFCGTPGDSTRCCSATFGALTHGGSATVTDSSGTSTGSINTSCNNGSRSWSGPVTCTLRCAAVPANTYLESQVGCNVGTDRGNVAMTSTVKGSQTTLFFSGTTTNLTLQCTDPGGVNGGYTVVSLNSCN